MPRRYWTAWGRRLLTLLLAACLLTPVALADDEESIWHGDWVNFLLICNEGMNNSGGNAGNTIMVIALNPVTGKIRLMMFTWDAFVDYEGYDVPQKLDMPYRNAGPEETLRVFDYNFDMNINHYLSLNYLNLAALIDAYGGVDIDITRAERNALNGMVGSKKARIEASVSAGLMSQMVVELIAQEYYLNEYGPNTHINGLQAVSYGWLQYDSVYNCCLRDAKVISKLFSSVGHRMTERIAFCTNETGVPDPDVVSGRRVINLDEPTEDDLQYLRLQVAPIFQMAYNNLTEDEIITITLALARTAYTAARYGVNIFDLVEYEIFPIEATQPYDLVAGTPGHLVDKEANRARMMQFLYGDQ